MYADGAIIKDPTFQMKETVQSKEDIIRKYTELSELIPDLKDEVTSIYPTDTNHVVVEFISSGTGPDGQKFTLPICTIFTFHNNQITHDFTYYDNF